MGLANESSSTKLRSYCVLNPIRWESGSWAWIVIRGKQSETMRHASQRKGSRENESRNNFSHSEKVMGDLKQPKHLKRTTIANPTGKVVIEISSACESSRDSEIDTSNRIGINTHNGTSTVLDTGPSTKAEATDCDDFDEGNDEHHEYYDDIVEQDVPSM